LFSRWSPKRDVRRSAPSTAGRLVYAIGDVHGRLDLLKPLIRGLAEDALASSVEERPMLVFLGDYIDRGPGSKGVVDCVLSLKAQGAFEVRCIKGNHEEALLQFLDDTAFGATWMEHGGHATLASYGVQPPASRTDQEGWQVTRDALAKALPPRHLAFYRSLELMFTLGDYAFVHAGVRPGVPLDQQAERDMLWIRGDFLRFKQSFGKVIVHGHTPMDEPQVTEHRLNLDTGAYATGILTAARLDNEGQRILQKRLGEVEISNRQAVDSGAYGVV
jgi:serine/threonine protein phosphatase 1